MNEHLLLLQESFGIVATGEREKWELPDQSYGRDRTLDFHCDGESQRSPGLSTATGHTFGNSTIDPSCVKVR